MHTPKNSSPLKLVSDPTYRPRGKKHSPLPPYRGLGKGGARTVMEHRAEESARRFLQIIDGGPLSAR